MDVFQSWLSGVQSPSDIAQAATAIFKKIDELPETDRNTVYDQLKSNSQFTEQVNRLHPQTA